MERDPNIDKIFSEVLLESTLQEDLKASKGSAEENSGISLHHSEQKAPRTNASQKAPAFHSPVSHPDPNSNNIFNELLIPNRLSTNHNYYTHDLVNPSAKEQESRRDGILGGNFLFPDLSQKGKQSNEQKGNDGMKPKKKQRETGSGSEGGSEGGSDGSSEPEHGANPDRRPANSFLHPRYQPNYEHETSRSRNLRKKHYQDHSSSGSGGSTKGLNSSQGQQSTTLTPFFGGAISGSHSSYSSASVVLGPNGELVEQYDNETKSTSSSSTAKKDGSSRKDTKKKSPRTIKRRIKPSKHIFANGSKPDFTPNKDYSIGASIGIGTYGSVYIGESSSKKMNDEKSGKGSRGRKKKASLRKRPDLVAVKVLSNTTRAWVEAVVLHTVQHEHIVDYRGVQMDENGRQVYLLMELLQGGEISNLIYLFPKHRMPETIARIYFGQIMSAVLKLHSEGISHCDIKPSNIMLTKDCSVVKLIDFGLSHLNRDILKGREDTSTTNPTTKGERRRTEKPRSGATTKKGPQNKLGNDTVLSNVSSQQQSGKKVNFSSSPMNVEKKEQQGKTLVADGTKTVNHDLPYSSLVYEAVGSESYAAPEVLVQRQKSNGGEGYDPLAADIWSCAVVLILMLSGKLPFSKADRTSAHFRHFISPSFKWPSRFSPMVCDLLTKMLQTHPENRISAAAVCSHDWLRSVFRPASSSSSSINSSSPYLQSRSLSRRGSHGKKKKPRVPLSMLDYKPIRANVNRLALLYQPQVSDRIDEYHGGYSNGRHQTNRNSSRSTSDPNSNSDPGNQYQKNTTQNRNYRQQRTSSATTTNQRREQQQQKDVVYNPFGSNTFSGDLETIFTTSIDIPMDALTSDEGGAESDSRPNTKKTFELKVRPVFSLHLAD